jgi:hypothetical protein
VENLASQVASNVICAGAARKFTGIEAVDLRVAW